MQNHFSKTHINGKLTQFSDKLTWVKLRGIYKDNAASKYLSYLCVIPLALGILTFLKVIKPGDIRLYALIMIYTGGSFVVFSRGIYAIFCPYLVDNYRELIMNSTSARLEAEIIRTIRGYLSSIGKSLHYKPNAEKRKEMLYVMSFLDKFTSSKFTPNDYRKPPLKMLRPGNYKFKKKKLKEALEYLIGREENKNKLLILSCYVVFVSGWILLASGLVLVFFLNLIKYLS